jgi:hypothetical protein
VRAEIYRWETAMKAPVGSDDWKSYWRGPGKQAYHAALTALETAPESAASTASVGGTPAAAPAPTETAPT